jgi:DNA-binding Lrp family transcriptional regulator
MPPTRADDDMLLDMLARARAGQSNAAIARHYGMTRESIRDRIRRVIEQDCRHDPEAHLYWSQRT